MKSFELRDKETTVVTWQRWSLKKPFYHLTSGKNP